MVGSAATVEFRPKAGLTAGRTSPYLAGQRLVHALEMFVDRGMLEGLWLDTAPRACRMSTPPQPSDSTRTTANFLSVGLVVKLLVIVAGLAVIGYSIWRQFQPRGGYKFDAATFAFVDHAESNVPLDATDVADLPFVDAAGMPVDLKQFRGRKNLVLVVTRGNTSGRGPGAYSGNICLYCATQTSRLIANYKSIQDSDAEVVVVFPVKQAADGKQLDRFDEAVKRDGASVGRTPFPVVLDVELRAVDQLGIRADLSKPATFILDKQGQVRFAYVGETIADRPSIQSILEQLAAINSDVR